MDRELDDLIGILEEQRDRQAALADLSEGKTAAIASGDAPALLGVVEREKAALALIRAVEKRQEACVGRLAAMLGVPPETLTMSVILEHARGERKETLSRLRGELTALIGKQQTANGINMKLLKMNLDYVQLMINASEGFEAAGATYGRRGGIRKAPPAPKQLLDRKV